MLFSTKMIYLGYETKTSKKNGSSYLLAKFMESGSIFEFYIPGDRPGIITKVGALKPFTESGIKLKLSSYQGKAQIDLEDVE